MRHRLEKQNKNQVHMRWNESWADALSVVILPSLLHASALEAPSFSVIWTMLEAPLVIYMRLPGSWEPRSRVTKQIEWNRTMPRCVICLYVRSAGICGEETGNKISISPVLAQGCVQQTTFCRWKYSRHNYHGEIKTCWAVFLLSDQHW